MNIVVRISIVPMAEVVRGTITLLTVLHIIQQINLHVKVMVVVGTTNEETAHHTEMNQAVYLLRAIGIELHALDHAVVQ